MHTLAAAALLSLGLALGASGSPCPHFDDLDVAIDAKNFRCAQVWDGEGSTNPNYGCNYLCSPPGSAYDEGVALDGDYAFSDAPGYVTPVGSLYVWPGCTYTGYSGYSYTGLPESFHGKYVNYFFIYGSDIVAGPYCPPGFASMTCQCSQEPVDCTPSDAYSSVLLCDNTLGSTELSCSYIQEVGTSYGSQEESSMAVSAEVADAIKDMLAITFEDDLATNGDTGYDWSLASSAVFEDDITQTDASVSAPAGTTVHVDQVVGFCGDNTSRTTSFIIYETTKDGQLVSGSRREFRAHNVSSEPKVKKVQRSSPKDEKLPSRPRKH